MTLNVLLAESQQVHQPAGLVQVVLGSSLHGASFRLLDHKQQQQHRDQSQTRSHLRRANTAQSISTDTQVSQPVCVLQSDAHPQSPVPVVSQLPHLRAHDVAETTERDKKVLLANTVSSAELADANTVSSAAT